MTGQAHSNGYFGHHSEYAEVLVFNRALTETEATVVNAYLSSKWNLTTVMDSDGDGVADADDADMVNPTVSIHYQVSQPRLPQQLARIRY